jgi:hypothetical protein
MPFTNPKPPITTGRFLLLFFPLALILSATTLGSSHRASAFKIVTMKAMLFYEDKGTFSEDVTDEDNGNYYPPKLWNTPIHYENRSSSVLVTVAVTGDPDAQPERKLELIARYVPLGQGTREGTREIVVRKIVSISIPTKLKEKDSFHAGFWLYDTGCDPVRLRARIIGPRETSTMKRVIKFDCGE